MTTDRQAFENAFKEEMLEKVAQSTGLEAFTEQDRQKVLAGCDEVLEKLASTPGAQGAFWEKPQDKTNTQHYGNIFGEGMAKAIGGATGSAAAGTALYGGNKLVKWINQQRNQHSFMDSINQAVGQNQVLQREYETEGGKEKIMSFAKTINRFAPSVATDSNLMASVLANAVQYDGIDTQTLQHLTDLEKRHGEVNQADLRNFK